jgi:hypothetical protein
MYFGYAEAGHPISAGDALGSGLMEWWLWAPFLPAVRALASRFPLARGRVRSALAVHLAGSVVASLLQILLFGAASAAIRQLRFGEGSLRAELASSCLCAGVVAYDGRAGFPLGDYAARTRRGRLARRAERSLSRRASARHAARRTSFNTLNAISAALREDPDGAERMLARPATPRAAARRDRATQTLRELDLLDGYLELQRDRFGERLVLEKHVDPGALGACVPSFLLLPLVENALQHGIAARPGPGRVRIAARLRDGRVEIAVEDDGVGLPQEPEALARRGLGLESGASACVSCTDREPLLSSCPPGARGAAIHLVPRPSA